MFKPQLWLSDGNIRFPIFISQIVFCLAHNQYAVINYIDDNDNTIKTFTVTTGLGILELKLLLHNFLRTGKSHLVNLSYVSKFTTKGKGSVFVPIVNKEFELSIKAKQALLAITKI